MITRILCAIDHYNRFDLDTCTHPAWLRFCRFCDRSRRDEICGVAGLILLLIFVFGCFAFDHFSDNLRDAAWLAVSGESGPAGIAFFVGLILWRMFANARRDPEHWTRAGREQSNGQ